MAITADYAITTVLAHWSTIKPAYRVILEDGTQLISSGDHRFLTERGWKYVTGARFGGLLRRPHLPSEQRADGGRRLRGATEGDRSLPARLPLRHDPRETASVGKSSYQRLAGPAADRLYSFRLPRLTDPRGRAD